MRKIKGPRRNVPVSQAQGIEAEQKTARFFVGADSPVFGAFKKSAKNAPKKPVLDRIMARMCGWARTGFFAGRY
jgi:hypothetical protein